MTDNRHWLIDLNSLKNSKVRLANNETIWDMMIKGKKNKASIIEVALLVSGMKFNLLNVGQLIEK